MKTLAALPALLLFLALPAAADPVGADACAGISQDREVLGPCLTAVAGPCYALRETEGDAAFAGCMAERALLWEREVAALQERLKPTGHAEAKSGRAARWLATRTYQCRDKERMAALAAEIGQDATVGAVAQCELTSSLIRADQLSILLAALRPEAAE